MDIISRRAKSNACDTPAAMTAIAEADLKMEDKNMKVQKLARLLSLFLMLALLVTTAAAEVMVPPEKSAGSPLDPVSMDASLSADPGQIMAEASDGKALGVFKLIAANEDGSKGCILSAFYCTDGSNTYIATDSILDKYVKDGCDSIILVGLNDDIPAAYLGTDKNLAFIFAEGLENYTPLEIGSNPVNEVTYIYLDSEDGETWKLFSGEVDLSTCQTENNYVFITNIAFDSSDLIGMPVVSKDNKLVGETYCGGEQLAIFRFVGTEYKLTPEFSLSGAPGDQGGSDEPGKAKKPMDKNMLYVIIGVAAAAALLRWKKKDNNQPQQQAAQGSIPLDPGTVNADAGFDKTKKPTVSAADGQDIYGPTVPNPSKDSLPAVPVQVQERKTIPVAQWQVRCVKGPLRGKVYPLGGKLTIGRSSQCDVKFPQEAPGVSATHCQLSVKDDQVYLQDLGSSFGTYYPQNNLLNARTDYPLHLGEVFTLAQDAASFRLEKMGAVVENDGFAIKDVNGRIYRSDAAMHLTLGRNPGCQGNFGDSEGSISGRHCMLYREEGKLYLMDLDSTNGTFFSQQERLKPNVPYRIHKGMAFFLTTSKYTFVVTEE